MTHRIALGLATLVVMALAGCREEAAAPSEPAERIGAARAALEAGAGSVGSCTGNPARCTTILLAAGGAHTVALKGDGTVWGWGDDSRGQLGGGAPSALSPVQVPGLGGVVAVAAGAYHTLALKGDGTLRALGDDSRGQLGDGTMSGVVALAAGASHSVALKSDGTVWA